MPGDCPFCPNSVDLKTEIIEGHQKTYVCHKKKHSKKDEDDDSKETKKHSKKTSEKSETFEKKTEEKEIIHVESKEKIINVNTKHSEFHKERKRNDTLLFLFLIALSIVGFSLGWNIMKSFDSSSNSNFDKITKDLNQPKIQLEQFKEDHSYSRDNDNNNDDNDGKGREKSLNKMCLEESLIEYLDWNEISSYQSKNTSKKTIPTDLQWVLSIKNIPRIFKCNATDIDSQRRRNIYWNTLLKKNLKV